MTIEGNSNDGSRTCRDDPISPGWARRWPHLGRALEQQRRQPCIGPICRCFVRVTQAEAIEFPPVRANDLNADRKSLRVEAGRDSQARATRHRDEQRPLHPFVIRLHPLTSNHVWPMDVGGKWKYLGGREDEEVVTLKKASHNLI